MSGSFFVRTLTGNSALIEYQVGDKINDLKPQIEDKLGIPADDQRLIFSGVVLDDLKLAKEYRFERHGPVFVVKKN